MDGNEVRVDLLFAALFQGALMSTWSPKRNHLKVFKAFSREHIVEHIFALLPVFKHQSKNIFVVFCTAPMEAFATGMTLWLSSDKVQLVVFSGSFGALCLCAPRLQLIRVK